MASKRRRTVMTGAERVKCIRLSKAGHKVKSIQQTLGVGKTQIYETLKNKASIQLLMTSHHPARKQCKWQQIHQYAQELPDIGDQRDSYLQLARKLYDTQANIVINQRMHPTKQSKIDTFFSQDRKK